jgi:hypothetical protein
MEFRILKSYTIAIELFTSIAIVLLHFSSVAQDTSIHP